MNMPNNIEKIICLDLELTCWDNDKENSKKSEIIEIGFCMLNVEKQGIEKPVSIYILPDNMDISEFCTNLTGITKKILYKQGKPLSEAFDKLINKFGSKNKTWCSFGEGDLSAIEDACKENKLIYPFSKSYLNVSALTTLKHKMISQRLGLEQALNIYKQPFIGKQHRAYIDAYNTAILLGLIMWGEVPIKLW